ncbi:MAG: hypothetical protein U1E14_07300 [Geminicoccaceae bacterium]
MARTAIFLELTGLALGGAALGAWLGALSIAPPPAPLPTTVDAPAAVRLCVTPARLCTAGPLPLGAPCGCTDALRGTDQGRVVSTAEALALIRDRPEPDDGAPRLGGP